MRTPLENHYPAPVNHFRTEVKDFTTQVCINLQRHNWRYAARHFTLSDQKLDWRNDVRIHDP